jgi:transcriptional regulator with XRE-family HTH domain
VSTVTRHAVAAWSLEHLGRDLAATRKRLGLSRRAAATYIGVSHVTIDRVESGKPCTTTSAILLLRWLDAKAAKS